MHTSEAETSEANSQKEPKVSEGVVLIDFWAPWCAPCRAQGPIVDKVAESMSGQATVMKCNVDETPELAQRFGVRSIPTLVILKDGKEVERFVGVQQEATLVASLKKHIGEK